MMRIVLIRPGATEYAQQGRIQGVLEVPLSQEGTSEAARISGELSGMEIDVIYSSGCEHALETANAIATALGIKVKPLEGFQNLDHGLWQGMLVEEIKHKQPKVYRQWQDQPESVCPPGGETLNEAQERVRAVVKKLLRKHKHGTVGLVVPEPLASLLRAYLEQTDVGDLWRAGTVHGTWEIIEVEPRSLAHSS
ncbi:MAG: phosphoglycerate mutase [Planctomycetia bacterium 21-64-5]|nr:MAG: phosphoglycerate mutase [Planctomycetia bacterium 21-64-5]HQU42813.1 histidine phosphatase family protein [Pirellulales bacterium]